MAVSVNEIFNEFDLPITGQVRWGQEIQSDKFGVYVIALTDKADKFVTLDSPKFNDEVISDWMAFIKSHGKNILIDNTLATTGSIKKRLTQFWLADETIIYIGRVGPKKRRTFRIRMDEFYKTKLGCNRRHSGGHWINALSNIGDLTIFYSEIDNPSVEEDMIKYFCSKVSTKSRASLFDTLNCFPFANKELNKSIRKKHGFSNQTVECGSNWKK